MDQQVRHWGSQLNWWVLNRGARIPDTDEIVPSGFNYLVSIESPNPNAIIQKLKRIGRNAATTFNELKLAYQNKCATCGVKEGDKDPRIGEIIVLQQGHMNPSLPLTVENTIPQCKYCNASSKDNFIYDVNGRIKSIYNANFILRSSKEVQQEMYEILKSKFQ